MNLANKTILPKYDEHTAKCVEQCKFASLQQQQWNVQTCLINKPFTVIGHNVLISNMQ